MRFRGAQPAVEIPRVIVQIRIGDTQRSRIEGARSCLRPARDPKLRDESLGPFPRTEHSVKVHRQEYYAIITHMDAQIFWDPLGTSSA